jgi:hypothetical protein
LVVIVISWLVLVLRWDSVGPIALQAVVLRRGVLHQVMTNVGTWSVMPGDGMVIPIEIPRSSSWRRLWLRREGVSCRVLIAPGTAIVR